MVTSSFLERGKLPVVAETDLEALRIAFRASCCRNPESCRLLRIKNTLKLDELLVSEPILKELEGNKRVEVLSDAVEIFDIDGNLCPFPE